jgi:putative protein-disulfide isomerase
VSSAILHYIYDPLCGWCYAAAPVVHAVRAVVDVRVHGGGMMAGPARQAASPQLRAYILPHTERITRMSGQRFGTAYVDGLLARSGVVLDSAPPIAAVMAADALGGRGLDYVERLQQVHYLEGQDLGDATVLAGIARGIGLDEQAFAEAYTKVDEAALLAHIREARALMGSVGGAGFPTFVLEREGRREGFQLSAFLGRPGDAAAFVAARVAQG